MTFGAEFTHQKRKLGNQKILGFQLGVDVLSSSQDADSWRIASHEPHDPTWTLTASNHSPICWDLPVLSTSRVFRPPKKPWSRPESKKNYPKRFNESRIPKKWSTWKFRKWVCHFPHRIHETGISTVYTPYMDPIRLGLAFITFSLNTYFGCFSVCAASRAPLCFQCHVFSATKRLRLDHPEEPHCGQWFNQGLQRKSF